MADNLVRVCGKSEIAPDSVQAFDVGDKRLAVFNIGGRYYVTDDECTHASASLADGMLDGEVIECAVHMARSRRRPAPWRCVPTKSWRTATT
jgi:nitrite reductase/ring-hydroxylating ferredoxin subunit